MAQRPEFGNAITRRHFIAQVSYATLAASWQAAPQRPLARFEFAEPYMGTMFKMVVYARDSAAAGVASRSAFERVAALDHIMSDYAPDSELRQLCRTAGGPPVRVSSDLFRVFSAAQDLSERSGGAFDISVGPVVQLWRRARRRHELPDPDRLAAALELVGYRNIRLNAQARTAQLLKPGMMLDLGGIAKGDAADQALQVLANHQITVALVAAAGDIAVADPPPGGEGWRIGLEPFESPASPPAEFVTLHGGAISTSGDSEQHVEIGGIRYSHIVNPKTGMALTGRRSITVVAPHGLIADPYATALCVMGPERGLELVAGVPGAAALVIEQNGDAPVRRYESCGFPPTTTLIGSADAQ